MAERRKPRKRTGKPAPESKRLSLLDLPPAMDPSGDLPTNPGRVIRPAYATTLLPAPAEPLADTSLASLALATRRATSVPREPHVTNRTSNAAPTDAAPADAALAPPGTVPSPPPDFGSPSTLPPPVQMPSEPPRGHAPSALNPWLRTLGVIVLSASVGAIVSSAMSGMKSGLLDVSKGESAQATRAAAMPICATTAALSPAPAPIVPEGASGVVPAGGLAPEAPRIAFDTLPLQSGSRRAVAVETISLESAPRDRDARPVTEAPPATHRALRRADASARAKSEPASSRPSLPTETLPKKPSRAAVSQAVGRAASAATACDSGPQDGKVMLTFAPSGAVQSVSLIKGFGDAAVNGCVLRAFGRARVPAFSGDPVQVRKSIAW